MDKPNLSTITRTMMPNHARLADEGKCPTCEKIIKEEEFRDDLSKQEYSISGLCQTCQDSVFQED